jgi:hypothetical protein
VLILSIILIVFQLPIVLRLKLSESAFSQYISDVRMQNVSDEKTSHWVGLYGVKSIEFLEDGKVSLKTSEDAGFIYSPHDNFGVRGQEYYRYLYGYWWYRSMQIMP